MSYKTVLLGRNGAANDAWEEPTPLSYLDFRNREALRAWRERSTPDPLRSRAGRKRSWLSALGWSDSVALPR